MIAFWIAAALLSAAVAVLIVLRSARAQARGPGEDPTLAVYRRQLSEIDDLAARGLLPAAERRSARAEAARRLLAAADAAPAASAGSGGRAAVIMVAVTAPLVALAAYLVVGSPQTPDQPYARRLAAWMEAASNNDTAQRLTSPELAAVLRMVVAKRPADPVPLVYLAHAEVDSGDPVAAEQDLKKAIALDPKRGELWELLGETIAMQAGDDLSPEAREAFERAIALNPELPAAHFDLGRAKIVGGDVKGGLAEWNALLALLPAASPARAALQQQIAAVQKTGALPPDDQTSDGDQQGMIRAMVARLAARLRAQPNDPEGWGRLIRSYAVLGDEPDRMAAMQTAHAEFQNRPDAWARVEQAEASPQ
ncbi:MAG TPA: c-type cytochrome biogenesis protein CcmI [Caulobacteraceae bacterium]|nr:c-type cytochrome biogenesis protein CcmI [Caulobacteraceae bacterium]